MDSALVAYQIDDVRVVKLEVYLDFSVNLMYVEGCHFCLEVYLECHRESIVLQQSLENC